MYKYIYTYIYILYTCVHILHTDTYNIYHIYIYICFISSHRHINDLLSCCNRSTIFSAKRSGALAVATAKLLHRERLVEHVSLVVF